MVFPCDNPVADKNGVVMKHQADRAAFPAQPEARKCGYCAYRTICAEGMTAVDGILRTAEAEATSANLAHDNVVPSLPAEIHNLVDGDQFVALRDPVRDVISNKVREILLAGHYMSRFVFDMSLHNLEGTPIEMREGYCTTPS